MKRFLPLIIFALVLSALTVFRGQIRTEFKKWQLSGSPVLAELLSQDYINKVVLPGNGQFDPNATSGVWDNREVAVPGDLSQFLANVPQTVLGESAGNKWIEVDLTSQHLYAHEGDGIAFDFPISSGLPWMPTVTGQFHIWAKVRAQRMVGGSVANGTYYDLPNVPFVQFFHGAYSLHGTYWHNDFGKPRSHGCVNISIPNAERLYYWTDPALGSNEYARYNIPPTSTLVVIHGTTPANIY